MLEIGIYKPQIPQNTGTLLRTSSCLGIHANIIGPMGFIFSDKKMKRSGMDYINTASYELFSSFERFISCKKNMRIVALDVNENSCPYIDFKFSEKDILLVGSEHSGFDNCDLCFVDSRVIIPMRHGMRSMNMAVAMAIVLGEAVRQLGMFSLK